MLMSGRPEKIGEAGKSWLKAIEADTKLNAEAKKVAGELARYIDAGGHGEVPSPAVLAIPVDLKEADAVRAINELIQGGHIILKWRPFQRPVTFFSIRPEPHAETVDMPPLLGSGKSPARTEAERLIMAAAKGLPHADAITALTEVQAQICASMGVCPDRETGADFLKTVADSLQARVRALELN